jgi:16S rRNA (guanine966-N2)-methyltransferase
VREALFSMLESRGVHWPDTRVLDLFAGSGSLGLEALSRGASFALFVEKGRRPAQTIRRALDEFGVGPERAAVEAADVFDFLSSGRGGPFDLVFVDPPYGGNLAGRSLRLLEKRRWLTSGAFTSAEIEAEAAEPDPPAGWEKTVDKHYGQTRILLWRTTH